MILKLLKIFRHDDQNKISKFKWCIGIASANLAIVILSANQAIGMTSANKVIGITSTGSVPIENDGS